MLLESVVSPSVPSVRAAEASREREKLVGGASNFFRIIEKRRDVFCFRGKVAAETSGWVVALVA